MTSPQLVTVAETISARMNDLSPAEMRIARAFLADYPSAGLSTVNDLGEASSASAATVVRFCTHLGYAGFTGMQKRLREELTAQQASPASRAHHDWTASDQGADVDSGLRHRAGLVEKVRETVPGAELDRAIALLGDTNRTLLFCGGKVSHLAARYLQLQLRHVRPHTYFLTDALNLDVGYLLDARKNDVLVVMDFRRYGPTTLAVAELAKKRGCTVVLFTDVWLSPIAQLADVVIPISVEASLFDSLTGVFAIVESMVPAIVRRIGPRALERMDAVEATPNYRPVVG